MNGRERVTRAIEMSGPDRLPVMHVTLPGAYRAFGQRLLELYERFPADVLLIGATGEGEFSGKAGVPSTDAWGSTWVSTTEDHKGLVEKPILENWDDFADFHAPSPVVPEAELAKGREQIAANAGEKYVVVDGDTLWQRMFYLRGYADTLVDLVANREKAAALRDLILEFMLARMGVWMELDVDGFMLRDDWGTQSALMIHPDLWRRFFKPAYKELCDLAHSGGKHLWFHSDGCIWDILPDMIEIGVDVINPQETLLGIERLGREFGGQVCFLGDVDRQYLLPFATPEEVRLEVELTIRALGSFNGGYIGRGEAAEDTPLENLEAMLAAFAAWRPEN